MKPTLTPLPTELLSATDALAEALLETEPFMLFERAQARLQTDPTANQLMERFASAQSELRRHQSDGTMALTEVETVRALQLAVQSNPSVQEYGNAQQAAAEVLRQVNQDISEVLGIDFGALTKRGCC